MIESRLARRLWFLSVLVMAAFACAPAAETAPVRHPPEIRGVFPIGAGPGATVTVTWDGASLADATEVLFAQPGLRATALRPESASGTGADRLTEETRLVATVHVAADAAPGVYEYRLHTPHGLSNVGQFVVGRALTEVNEEEPNGEQEEARAVTTPVALNGRFGEKADLDYWAFTATEGETLVAEAIAEPAGSRADTLLTLFDEAGHEVATNDDARGKDSRLVWQVAKSGRYLLQVSESAGAGGVGYGYRVHLSRGPSLTGPTIPVRALVTELPRTDEREPNDAAATAQPIAVPGAVLGAIGAPGDRDRYLIRTASGRRWQLRVVAAESGSRLDSVLTVTDGSGKRVDRNDDGAGRDARIEREFGDGGPFTIEVEDVLGRGGPEYPYLLEVREAPGPGFSIASDLRYRGIERGGTAAFEVIVTRDRWNGPVTLAFADLPPGVTGSRAVVPEGRDRGWLSLVAAADAPSHVFPLKIVGTAEVNGAVVMKALDRCGDWTSAQIPAIANVSPEMRLLAVCEPFEIRPVVDALRLVVSPGSTTKLRFRIERRVAYEKPIEVRLVGLPDGVTARAAVLFPDRPEGELEVTATAAARPGDYPVLVAAVAVHSQFVFLDRYSAPLTLTVREE